MNFMLKGSMTYMHGGTMVKVEADSLTVFWGTMPHQVIARDESAQLVVMNVPMPWFMQWRLPALFSQDIVRGQLAVDPSKGRGPQDRALFSGWYKDLQEGSSEHKKIVALEVEARLRRLALDWEKAHPGERKIDEARISGGSAFEKVEKITTFIAEHFAEPLHVDDIARQVGLHPNYTMNLFQKHCGLSLVEYLTQHRVAHAQRLLATTDAKVLDIALQSGFGSASRFYAAFMKVCGRSPKDFRSSMAFAANDPGLQPQKFKYRGQGEAYPALPKPKAKKPKAGRARAKA